MTDQRLETIVINKYLVSEKRERYLNFISSEKNRHKFIEELYHPKFFQDNLFELISGVHKTDAIMKAISKKTFKDCYIISTNKAIDAKRLDIKTALNQALSGWADHGTLIVFGDADIIYREHEGKNNRWISKA